MRFIRGYRKQARPSSLRKVWSSSGDLNRKKRGRSWRKNLSGLPFSSIQIQRNSSSSTLIPVGMALRQYCPMKERRSSHTVTRLDQREKLLFQSKRTAGCGSFCKNSIGISCLVGNSWSQQTTGLWVIFWNLRICKGRWPDGSRYSTHLISI